MEFATSVTVGSNPGRRPAATIMIDMLELLDKKLSHAITQRCEPTAHRFGGWRRRWQFADEYEPRHLSRPDSASRRTTVSLDQIISVLLSLKLGYDPGSEDAHSAVRAYLQEKLDVKNDPLDERQSMAAERGPARSPG